MLEFDIIIKNGTIVDGTGGPKFVGDIGVRDGKISAIGAVRGEAREVIDATGLIVAPGVIDPHTHYDAQIYWDPYCTNSGWHGVTSVVVGNCGFGFAPCRPEDRDGFLRTMESTEQIPAAVMRRALPWDWVTYPEWIESMKRIPKGINVGAFLPLNSLMIWVMGLEAASSRPATEDERTEMRRLLHEAMDHGALGFGFSFLQEHNTHKQPNGSPMVTDSMDIEETYNLARVLRERGEGTIQALIEVPTVVHRAEVEELARISGRPVLHTVIMALDAMPEYHTEQLAWLEDANARGLNIYAQALAFRGWNESRLADWDIWQGLPIFAEFQAAGDVKARAAKAADPEYRDRLRTFYRPEMMIPMGGPLETYVLNNAAGAAKYTPFEGRTFGEIAIELGEAVTDVVMDLMAESKLEAEIKLAGALSRNLDFNTDLMKHPRVLPGTSDGGAHGKFWSGGQYGTDLIAWLVRDNARMTLEELHHKLSSVPATALGLTERGELVEGKAADIYMYDLDDLGYNADRYDIAYDLPGGDWRRVARARGIRRIIVNGQVTFNDNNCRGTTPGQLLTTTKALAAV
jgi:N-acyl-D-amino-acid deacylase